MNKIINTLIDDLKSIFNERLLSIILYGSLASGEYQEKVSDINLLVVLDKLTAKDLKTAYPAIKKWQKTKNPLPVFTDMDELCTSCGVYAIEYSDIKERNKILYGKDLFGCINIDKANLRLQCESEIKRLITRLRQLYLGNSNDKKFINNLIKKSSTSFIAVFRAILRILDEQVPKGHKDVVSLLAQKTDFDKDVFMEIISLREQNKNISQDEAEKTIQRLINSLNRISNFVDKMDKQ